MCLFHVGLVVAGQLDVLFVNKDGGFALIDWKRSKDIQFENAFNRFKHPLYHLPDTNFWRYALQLNVYRFALETEYAFVISDICTLRLYTRHWSSRF